MLKVGIIGYGYWGPNIARNFHVLDGVQVCCICDKNPRALARATKNYPGIKTTTNPHQVTSCAELDIVAVITPVFTHFELTKAALNNNKHVFVEKPFTQNASQAQILIDLAEKKRRKIMVDHTFLFTGAVRKIKELVDNDVLGDLYYYDSTRVNLGLFQHDVNVIWDLAPHDFSIMDYVLKEKPIAIAAHGKEHFRQGLQDIAYVTVYFQSNIIAHFNFNWLSPVKVRSTLIGAEKRMLVWNDVVADEKIKVYDKGVSITSSESIYQLLVEYRSGDMFAPKLDSREALNMEIAYFIDSIVHNTTIINDGHAGLRIVKLLQTTDESIKKNGKIIELSQQ